MKTLIAIFFSILFAITINANEKINFYYSGASESIALGIDKLNKILSQKNIVLNKTDNPSEAYLKIYGSTNDAKLDSYKPQQLQNQGYEIIKDKKNIVVIGGDEVGALYALLKIAEKYSQTASFDNIESKVENPRFEFRAIKFNLPYMAYRTDKSTAQHFATCRNIEFWESFLDMMVENRFNVLSLWSLHLFHYMIIPENFPEASHFSTFEMEDWKNFWTELFHMAKIRGIDTYVINWNTVVSPSFASTHNVAKYSRKPSHYGPGDTTKLVEQYMREVVEQVINEYPDLSGLGITLGERMGGQEPSIRRDWLDRTFFTAMQNADRKIKFVYRAPLSANAKSGGSTSEENDLATRHQIEQLETEGPVWVEFKYNWSHGHSSPNLFIVHGGKLTDKYRNPLPDKFKYIWTVRNEDFHVNRWGQSDFIREFIANNGKEYVGGCFIGSEGYIPAKDVFTKPGEHKTWTYAFERQWLFYAMWGRLLYNPKTSDSEFAALLESKYGNKVGEKALEGFKTVSKVPLMFASFRQGRNDLSLYTESFAGWREFKQIAFFDINNFNNRQVLDTIRYININEYVRNGENVKEGMFTPYVLADSLDKIAEKGMQLYQELRSELIEPSSLAEIQDIESWCWFAKYFATKLRAGVAFAKAEIKNEDTYPESLNYLNEGVGYFENYIRSITTYNNDSFLFHTKDDFSWNKLIDFVKADISIVKSKMP